MDQSALQKICFAALRRAEDASADNEEAQDALLELDIALTELCAIEANSRDDESGSADGAVLEISTALVDIVELLKANGIDRQQQPQNITLSVPEYEHRKVHLVVTPKRDEDGIALRYEITELEP